MNIQYTNSYKSSQSKCFRQIFGNYLQHRYSFIHAHNVCLKKITSSELFFMHFVVIFKETFSDTVQQKIFASKDDFLFSLFILNPFVPVPHKGSSPVFASNIKRI